MALSDRRKKIGKRAMLPQFFIPSENIGDRSVVITGTDVNHISNVLRLVPGDMICAAGSDAVKYTCRILSVSRDEVVAEILEKEKSDTELPVSITLFQGVPKRDKMDLIVQKTVELGVARVVPVLMERTVVRWDEKKKKKHGERWQSIAEAAAKQSGRGLIPEVVPPMDWADALALAAEHDRIVVPYESAADMAYTRSVFEELKDMKTAAFFIGPEGGFSTGEIAGLEKLGARIVTLGKRILRTETAGLAVMSMLGYVLEE